MSAFAAVCWRLLLLRCAEQKVFTCRRIFVFFCRATLLQWQGMVYDANRQLQQLYEEVEGRLKSIPVETAPDAALKENLVAYLDELQTRHEEELKAGTGRLQTLDSHLREAQKRLVHVLVDIAQESSDMQSKVEDVIALADERQYVVFITWWVLLELVQLTLSWDVVCRLDQLLIEFHHWISHMFFNWNGVLAESLSQYFPRRAKKATIMHTVTPPQASLSVSSSTSPALSSDPLEETDRYRPSLSSLERISENTVVPDPTTLPNEGQSRPPSVRSSSHSSKSRIRAFPILVNLKAKVPLESGTDYAVLVHAFDPLRRSKFLS